MYSTISIRTALTPGSGALSFFEANRDIPFEIKRIYYIYNVPQNTQRGAHAHKELKQLLFCPYGSVKVLLDDGEEKTEVMLDHPAKALIVNPLIWHDMIWCEKDSVLCVAASDYYNEDDYLRDYAAFKEYLMNHTAEQSRR